MKGGGTQCGPETEMLILAALTTKIWSKKSGEREKKQGDKLKVCWGDWVTQDRDNEGWDKERNSEDKGKM